MATSTSSSTGFGGMLLAVGAVIALLVGGSLLVRNITEDDEQSFVDFEATWSQERAMVATIEIGGEPELTLTIQRDEAPRVGIRRTAYKGQTVRMIVTPVDQPGTVSCSITADEQIIDEDQAEGMEECFVEGIVP